MSDNHDFKDELGQAVGPKRAAEEFLEVQPTGPGAETASGSAAEAPVPPASSDVEWAPLLKVGIGALFAMLASKWKSFETTDEELEQLAAAWAPVAQKYAGSAMSVETMAIVATVVIVAPKALGAVGEAKAARKKKLEAQRPRPDPGTTHIGTYVEN